MNNNKNKLREKYKSKETGYRKWMYYVYFKIVFSMWKPIKRVKIMYLCCPKKIAQRNNPNLNTCWTHEHVPPM